MPSVPIYTILRKLWETIELSALISCKHLKMIISMKIKIHLLHFPKSLKSTLFCDCDTEIVCLIMPRVQFLRTD